jgi:hypothetical protein
MPKPGGCIVSSNGFESFGDGLLQGFGGAGLGSAQVLFEL